MRSFAGSRTETSPRGPGGGLDAAHDRDMQVLKPVYSKRRPLDANRLFQVCGRELLFVIALERGQQLSFEDHPGAGPDQDGWPYDGEVHVQKITVDQEYHPDKDHEESARPGEPVFNA